MDNWRLARFKASYVSSSGPDDAWRSETLDAPQWRKFQRRAESHSRHVGIVGTWFRVKGAKI